MPRNESRDRSPRVNGGRRYAKISAAAIYIGCRESTVRTMIADGRLTRYQLGPRILRVDLNEVDVMMADDGVRAPDNTTKAIAARKALLKAKDKARNAEHVETIDDDDGGCLEA